MRRAASETTTKATPPIKESTNVVGSPSVASVSQYQLPAVAIPVPITTTASRHSGRLTGKNQVTTMAPPINVKTGAFTAASSFAYAASSAVTSNIAAADHRAFKIQSMENFFLFPHFASGLSFVPRLLPAVSRQLGKPMVYRLAFACGQAQQSKRTALTLPVAANGVSLLENCETRFRVLVNINQGHSAALVLCLDPLRGRREAFGFSSAADVPMPNAGGRRPKSLRWGHAEALCGFVRHSPLPLGQNRAYSGSGAA